MPIAANKIAECTKSAIYCYGTGYIFELRAKEVRWKTRLLTFLGIACPVAVGASVAAFSTNSKATGVVIFVTALLSIPQVIFSVWSLVAKWDDNLYYSLESKTDNYRLSNDYRQLSGDPALDQVEFENRYAILD